MKDSTHMLALIILPNGAELIGKIITDSSDALTLEHPLVIRPFERNPGDYALQLYPHSLANPEGAHQFTVAQIQSRCRDIPKELERAYTERTTSIILASAMDQLERG